MRSHRTNSPVLRGSPSALLLCATALFLQLLFLAPGPKGGSFFVAAQQPSPAVSANATAVVDFLQLTNMEWHFVNHDAWMTRNSPQNVIGISNVADLTPLWTFEAIGNSSVENSPVIVGNTTYFRDNAARVYAVDIRSGNQTWVFDPSTSGSSEGHGVTFFDGVIYSTTSGNDTVVALNATNGQLIWQSARLSAETFVNVGAPPVVYQDSIIMGSAGGDVPPGGPGKGTVTALNRTTGERLWQTPLTVGAWVEGDLATVNGGATTWSGGALDVDTGIIYMPAGNAAPDFNASTRPGEQLYSNHLVAINATDGSVVWATPFIHPNTSLNISVAIPDVHDYDVAWGSLIRQVDFGQGPQKIVIGHDKFTNLVAMNASTGAIIWHRVVGVQLNTEEVPSPEGTNSTYPNTQSGIESYLAADQTTLYAAVSNSASRFFSNATEGRTEPAFDAPGMENFIGNGSILAIDLKTGNTKWEFPTSFPTWVSPLVTNGIVFSGHITAPGQITASDEFSAPLETQSVVQGVLIALDANNGTLLWQHTLDIPIGIGGPSISPEGLLLVPTGSPDEIGSNTKGTVVAFGLPPSSS